MKNLSLHSTGKSDFIKLLKEKYDNLALDLKSNQSLSKTEKEEALKSLNEKYKSEKHNAEYILFAKK